MIEEPATFGPRGGLSGVLCSPAGATDPSRPAIVILNTGHHRRTGAGRLGVVMARKLAAEGWTSLRFDLAGLGDSDPQAGKAENMVYDIEAVADVSAALDWLEARGHRKAVAVGVCSGAYMALHAARADKRIVAQTLVNLRRFTWRKGETFATATRAGTKSAQGLVGEARAAWRRADIWLRLARGGRKEWSLVGAAVRRAIELAQAKTAAKAFEWFGVEGQIAGWISALGRRGTTTMIAYSVEDEGLGEFHTHLGRAGERVRQRDALRLASIADADHTLTTRVARANFIAAFAQFLAEEPWAADERAGDKGARARSRAATQPAEALVAL
jgi:alpha/beta superfamily hydrolase